MKFDKVFKYNLIKIWTLATIWMLVFTNAIYNVLLHRWYNTKNKSLTNIFAIMMPLYLIFATAKVKTEFPSYFLPNFHAHTYYQAWQLQAISIKA